MKKSLYLLLLALMLAAFSFTMASCESEDDSSDGDASAGSSDCSTGDHIFAGTYSSDDDAHWYACTNGCGAKFKVGEHVWGDPVVKEDSSCTEMGLSTRTCIVCEKTKDHTIALKKHVAIEGYEADATNHWQKCGTCSTTINQEAHTFTSVGYDADQHWIVCKCGYKTDSTAHTWIPVDENDNSINRLEKCTAEGCLASRTAPNTDHECVYDDGTITTPASCTTPGVKTYKCTVSGCQGFYTKSIGVSDHDFTGAWDHDQLYHWHICKVCGTEPPSSEKTEHNYSGKPTTDGYNKVYTCECGATKTDKSEGYIDPEGWT